MKAIAPGKLILSGEHSVVYGSPAIVLAINRYAVATITRELLPRILFDLADLPHQRPLSLEALSALKARIKHKYHRFIRGDFSIREVLKKPFELAQFALGIAVESLNVSLPHGVKIHVESSIPIGCGMGSSAATILSVMKAISTYLQVSITEEKLFKMALLAENMQHGKSSGLDLRVSMQGGCLYVHKEEVSVRNIPTIPMFLINTGTPSSGTGECVEKVAHYFKSEKLIDEFTTVTNNFDRALQSQSLKNIQEIVRENHKLLTHIGVVPEKVKLFIDAIEASGDAAKICGAGSVKGDRAGAVIVFAENQNKVSELATRFGYNVISILGEMRGLHVV